MNLLYIALLLLIFVLLIDLIFYVKIRIHLLINQKGVYLYVFSLPILIVSKDKTINLLKNKISLEKIKNTQKEDLKIIESFNIDQCYINCKPSLLKEYCYIVYPLIGAVYALDQILKRNDIRIETKENKDYYFYGKLNIKIDNIIKQLINIRRLKNERTSH